MGEKPTELSHLNQPFPYGRALLDALSPSAQFRQIKRGTKLAMIQQEEQMCYLVDSGTVEVHRTADQLMIVTFTGPAMIGLSGVQNVYLVVTSTSRIAAMPLKVVHEQIEQLDLWEIYAQHMMIVTNKLYTYSKQLSAPTAYELICNQLQELMNEPEDIRLSIPVERYIRDKTHISRSSIMKILSDLRTGGYIVSENGRLVKILHLPLKY